MWHIHFSNGEQLELPETSSSSLHRSYPTVEAAAVKALSWFKQKHPKLEPEITIIGSDGTIHTFTQDSLIETVSHQFHKPS